MSVEGRPGAVRPGVFERRATGLRREVSAADTFIYNTNNQNIGIGVAFMVLLVPAFYPGGNMLLATAIAILLALPMAFVYAYFAGTMPRSGGDYVYVSRTLHPALGFLTSWNWVVWLIAYTGIPAAYLGQYGLSGFFRLFGVAIGSSTVIGWGDWFATSWGIFTAGTILLALFTGIFALGMQIYFRIQKIMFGIAMLGVLTVIVILLVRSQGGVAGHFQSYVSSLGGPRDANAAVAQEAAKAGFATGDFSFLNTMYAAVWPLFITLYAITSSFISGEVRNAKRSQLISMPGSVLFVGGFMLVLSALVLRVFDTSFLGQVGTASPGSLGMKFAPTYNELTGMLVAGSALLAFVVGFCFIFWTYVWLPINFLASTRAFLAWSLDGLLPRKLAEVSPRTHTPLYAIGTVFVLGEISLILYVTKQINTLNGIWAWILSFVITSAALVVFPFRRRELFEASPFNRRIAGVPAVTLLGLLSLAALGVVEWIFWADPIQGLGNSPYMQKWTIGVFASGLLFYLGAVAVQRLRGVAVDKVFAEIPPE